MQKIVSDLLQFHAYRQIPVELENYYKDVVKTAAEFKEKTEGKQHLVWFYAHWCGHCRTVVPEWDKLKQMKNLGCELLEIDCAKHPEIRDLMSDHISGFPTFLFIGKDIDDFYKYHKDERTAENFAKFIQEKKT